MKDTSRESRLPFGGRARSLLSAMALAALALMGCAEQRPRGTLSDAARLRLTEAMDRNNPAAPDAASLAVLRDAAARNPSDVGAQERLAQGALAAGFPAEAAVALRRALAISGPVQSRLLELGRAEIRAGNAAGAVEAYRQAQAAGPPNPAIFGGLGLAYDMAGDSPAAEEAHRRAVAMAPQDWTLRGNLALSLLFAGRASEGVRVLSTAESDSAAPRRARHNLALLLTADGQMARAVRVLRMDMGPTEADAMARDFQAFAQWVGTVRSPPTRLLPSVEPVVPSAPAAAPAATPSGGTTSMDPIANPADAPAPRRGRRSKLPAAEPQATAGGAQAQLAALDSEADAQRAWERLTADHPGLLDDHQPLILPVTLRGQLRWRLRVDGFGNVAEAARFCGRLRARNQACYVAQG